MRFINLHSEVESMKSTYYVYADDILEGKVKPEDLTMKYFVVTIRTGLRMKKKREEFFETVNYLAKLGWRAVGWSGMSVLMESPD